MRFLVDENLPVSLARWLASQGFEADHTRDLDLSTAADRQIVQEALRMGAVIVTKDSDFLTLSAAARPPVVHLRVGNRSSAQLLELCARVWPQVVSLIEGGERLVQVGGV